MDKKKILLIGCFSLVIVGLLVAFVILVNREDNKEENEKKEEKTLEIQTYSVQSHEYFDNLPDSDQFIIDSVEELNKFYYIFSDKFMDELNLSDSILKDYTMFIKVKEESSGSISVKLDKVKVNKEIEFVISESKPEVGTADMAFWYLVALIPNTMLEKKDTTGWVLPSEEISKMGVLDKYEFNMNTSNKYIITTDMKWKTMQDDGGSYTSIYYQIDLDNKTILKYKEIHEANLGGESKTDTKNVFVHRIDEKLNQELKTELDEIRKIVEENPDKTNLPYKINSKDFELTLYDKDNIKKVTDLIEKIDN